MQITPSDQLVRKRITHVYNRIFKPLIEAEKHEEVCAYLRNIVDNGTTCIDACRQALEEFERHPNVMLSPEEAPTIFQRLAHILRDFKLQCIMKVAAERAAIDHKDNDTEDDNEDTEYDLFLKIACSCPLSLLIQQQEQFHSTYVNYTVTTLTEDVRSVLDLYYRGMIDAVTRAISCQGMPRDDRDIYKIYLRQINDWATETPMHCNSADVWESITQKRTPMVTNLEEDLAKEDTEPKLEIKPIVVMQLLRHGGYIEFDDTLELQ